MRDIRAWWRTRGTTAALIEGQADVRCSHVIPPGAHGAAFASLVVPSARLYVAGKAAGLRQLSEIAARLAEWCEGLGAGHATGQDPYLGKLGDLPATLGIPAEVWLAPEPMTAVPPRPLWYRLSVVAAFAVFVVGLAVWR